MKEKPIHAYFITYFNPIHVIAENDVNPSTYSLEYELLFLTLLLLNLPVCTNPINVGLLYTYIHFVKILL